MTPSEGLQLRNGLDFNLAWQQLLHASPKQAGH